MMPLALALFLGAPTAAQVEARFQRWWSSTPRLAVELKSSTTRTPLVVQGRLVIARPTHQSYEVQLGLQRYAFIQEPGRTIELDHVARTYTLALDLRHLVSPGLVMEGLEIDAYPLPLLTGKLLNGFPPEARLLGRGSGKLGDLVGIRAETPGGPVDLTWVIDAQGRLREMQASWTEEGRPQRSTVTLSNYTQPKSPPRAWPPPPGYKPTSIPSHPDYVEVGERLPSTIDLGSGGGIVLVALVDSASALGVDQRLLRRLTSLATELRGTRVKTVDLARLSASQTAAWRGLAARGTPAFYLVDRTRMLRYAWLGFDPDAESAWIAEVRARIGEVRR